MKKILQILLFTAITLCFASLTAFAAENDADNDGFHDGDVAALDKITSQCRMADRTIDKSGPVWTFYIESYGDLIYAKWNDESPRRLTYVDVGLTKFNGEFDASSFEKLETAYLYDNSKMTSVKLPQTPLCT